MRVVRFVVYAFMALVLAGGWAYLYWQSSVLDLDGINAARGALNAVRAVDARWNEQLVGARLLSSGAPQAPVSHARAFAELEGRTLALLRPGMGQGLAGLKAALDAKSITLQRIAAGEPLFERAWRSSTGPRLDVLSRMFDRAYDEALLQAELHRAWLLYYSAFLLLVLAWMLGELYKANTSLERRVAARTAELSAALARLKASEAMLVQSEKMSSLGQMVAGLAHEVNTPLAYVRASLESARTRAGDAGRIAREADRLLDLLAAERPDEAALAAQFAAVRKLIEEKPFAGLESQLADGLHGIVRISELMENLRDFSRLDRGKVADFNLHEGIDSTLRIAQYQLGKRTVRKTFGEIPPVTCSPSQINQVLLNLVLNAAQATPEEGGMVAVRTAMRDEKHVAIDIADNGHGIPAEVLPRIFDPFFTTKEVGKGTGLGLAICYRIIESHGGRIEVQSQPGNTRFTVVLPVSP